MKTILDIINLSAEYLQTRGIEQPKRQAEEVIADTLGLKRMQLYLEYDRPLIEQELDLCRKNLARRGGGEPAAYIRGFVEFYHCKIGVSSAVLIPRPETEILVDKIVKKLEQQELEGKILWDICCGSGCMGIALKKQFPQLQVVCSDLSKDALEIASQNASHNQIEIKFVQGDLFKPFQGQKADIVVCNPPYISERDYLTLDREVRDFEPKLALIGGPDGLQFYRRLAQDLPSYLNRGGKVWLEIGWEQGQHVSNLFKSSLWKACLLEKDWAGHDRFISLEIE